MKNAEMQAHLNIFGGTESKVFGNLNSKDQKETQAGYGNFLFKI
jgi:hypothetical protein